MDCDPDSNPDSGPGARVNAAIDYAPITVDIIESRSIVLTSI